MKWFNCQICNRLLNNPNDPYSEDCGGDCLKCMAECGDPECEEAVRRIDETINSTRKAR